MTKEEILEEQTREINAMIDRYDMQGKCNLSREAIVKKVKRSMILNNLAFILADAANTFLMQMEEELSKFGIAFSQNDKYNFNQMMKHIVAARKWAEKSALPIYEINDVDDACADADWWVNFIPLVDDRTGDDKRKTNLLLEYILNMPSEIGLFEVKYEDFKRFKKE